MITRISFALIFGILPMRSFADSDGAIRAKIVAQSIAAYRGSCPCPEFKDRAGRRCGKRSAYHRGGGASPLCYHSDVTPEMIRRYKGKN